MIDPPNRQALDDDTAAMAFLVALIHETPDVYLRKDAELTPSTSLRDELGLDSIGLIGVFYAIIDEFGCDADESVVGTWRTVDDLLGFARSCATEEP